MKLINNKILPFQQQLWFWFHFMNSRCHYELRSVIFFHQRFSNFRKWRQWLPTRFHRTGSRNTVTFAFSLQRSFHHLELFRINSVGHLIFFNKYKQLFIEFRKLKKRLSIEIHQFLFEQDFRLIYVVMLSKRSFGDVWAYYRLRRREIQYGNRCVLRIFKYWNITLQYIILFLLIIGIIFLKYIKFMSTEKFTNISYETRIFINRIL